MTDNGEPISTTSSLEDLSILDPDDYQEIADTIPTVAFIDDDVQVIQLLLDNEEEDLSAYVKDQTDDHQQLPPSEGLLQATTSYADSLSPGSASPFGTLSPLTSPSFDIDFLDWLEPAEGVDDAPQGGQKNLSKTIEDRWSLLSSLKEEIRWKIQLRRVISGQEELKVDFTAPSATLCYDAVKKRNEVREKNKEYAKQSRDRVKHERKHLEQINQRLKQSNEELKKDMIKWKEMMTRTDDFLHRHHQECKVCSHPENICSICPKEITGKLADFKRAHERMRSRIVLKKANKSRDFSPEAGPSGLSKITKIVSSLEMATKSRDVNIWSGGDLEAKMDKYPHKPGTGNPVYRCMQSKSLSL